ncbi:MAG: protein-glutamate O-methyltransferase CheR [Sulfitobacter sp.]|nr:protein-glutamate O-methyltransferase CheR [Sulfitobacter sp.]
MERGADQSRNPCHAAAAPVSGAAERNAPVLPISSAAYAQLAEIALHSIGLALGTSRKSMVQRRLSPRLRQLGLASFDDYLALLREDSSEVETLSWTLTTNVTQFFREDYHFDHLAKVVLPDLASRAARGDPIRIWSCACSSGEEPYSIAMSVIEQLGQIGPLDLRILATDIDSNILKVAQRGSYLTEDCKGLDKARRQKHFHPDPQQPDRIMVNPEVRALIDFARLNLLQDWPFRRLFDVIFCRNVAIYFDKDTQHRLWTRLAHHLAPGGTLCVGHSESIPHELDGLLRKAGIKTYTRHAK